MNKKPNKHIAALAKSEIFCSQFENAMTYAGTD